MIGANNREENINGNGPPGPRMVANGAVPLNGANPNHENGGAIICNLCNRPFATDRGLGQHMRLSHPVEYNARINVERVKARWSEEELNRMAREEARAVRDGIINMNMHLGERFPGRTLEGIKGKRKSQEYRNLVQRFRDLGPDAEMAVQTANEGGDVDNNIVLIKSKIQDLIASLDKNRLNSTNRLKSQALAAVNGTSLESGFLMNWLRSIFPHARPPGGPSYEKHPQVVGGTRYKRRRQEYAEIQKLYKKDFSSAVRRILASGDQEVKMPETNEVIAFWKRIFENDPVEEASASIAYAENEQLKGMWAPISLDDIGKYELDLESAPGPDGISVANWRSVSKNVRALFYNLVLLNGSLESDMKCARTVLIPKGVGNIGPGETRPLSITSVVVRQLHKILAGRLKALHTFSESQRAFIDCDGTLENLSIISTILADARMSRKEVHIATLDLRKAFDSVSHKTIIDTITELGFPKSFINYIKLLYTDSKTMLQYNSTNTILRVNQGVLQGDPLSPLLFNAVIDRAIKQIPAEIGYKINGMNFNMVAYADDIVGIASTREGLQTSLNVLSNSLSSFGLEMNIEKSSTLSLVPSGREKKTKVITESLFTVNNTPLRAIGILDTWKYLGIHFAGSKTLEREINLATDLELISKAPLKPQQRLRVLCSALLSRHLHALVLGRVTITKLNELDRLIRKYVKRWLYLPADVPDAYIYARVRDGGLGVTNLTQQVPLIRKSRLNNFINKANDTSRTFKESYYIKRQLEWCDRLLEPLGTNATKSKQFRYWRDVLSMRVDTNDLTDARHDAASYKWVCNRANDISGSDYIHFNHIRAGCLPSKARTTRGRVLNNRQCRAGCNGSETNYHVIQQCQRTHGGRVHRHDRVVNMLHDQLITRSNTKVLKEARFKTHVGLRKPDLLITRDKSTVVLDVQIVNGHNMGFYHETKISKYRDIPGFDAMIKRRCASRTVEFHAITISYKGLIERKSSETLNRLGINEQLKFLIVTSVLRGAWLNWNSFNRMTTRTR